MATLSLNPAALARPALRTAWSSSLVAQRRRELLVLTILAAVQFTTNVGFMIVIPLAPQLMRELGITPAGFGLIVSSYTFAAGAAGLVASTLVDRFPRRNTFLVLYAGFVLGTFLCAVAPSYAALVAARVLTGAFGGILGGLSMTIVGDVFPERRRGRATGLLMTGFALASVAGVPFGLFLGSRYGWHMPFIVLATTSLPTLLLTFRTMPRLDAHVRSDHAHPLRALGETFGRASHVRAFALSAALTTSGYAVFPYVGPFFVGNVGLPESRLPLLYVVGGLFTLFAAPQIGKLADRYGKLRVLAWIVPMSAALLITVTALPRVHAAVAVTAFGALMVANVGRMVAAMALITAGVEPHRRGAFLSANSTVQHVAAGLGVSLGGLIITQAPGGPVERFPLVGCLAAILTLWALRLAGRVQAVDAPPVAAETLSMAAAAEVTFDSGEFMAAALDDDEVSNRRSRHVVA
jgi:predicted MFS family arabinose efflux permease